MSEKVLLCLKAQEKKSPLNGKSAIVCRLMNIPSAEAAASSPIFQFGLGPASILTRIVATTLRSRPCPKGNHVVTIPDVIEGTRGMQTPANRSFNNAFRTRQCCAERQAPTSTFSRRGELPESKAVNLRFTVPPPGATPYEPNHADSPHQAILPARRLKNAHVLSLLVDRLFSGVRHLRAAKH